jgi:hypothetical protein
MALPLLLLYPLIGAALGMGTQAARGKTSNKDLWRGAGFGALGGLGGGALAPAAAGGMGGWGALTGAGAKAGATAGTAGAAAAGKGAATAGLSTVAKQAAIQTAIQGALQGGLASMQPDISSSSPLSVPGLPTDLDSQALMEELLKKTGKNKFQWLS